MQAGKDSSGRSISLSSVFEGVGAFQAGQIDEQSFNEVASRVPHLAKVAPASDYHIEDVHNAGGISAILNELSKKEGTLLLDCMTVTGKTLKENIAGAEIKNTEVIHKLDHPHSEQGGLSVLFGNLAPEGAIIKVGAVDASVGGLHVGPAICFDSQDDALHGIANGKVKEGDVVVIRYEGHLGVLVS